ncbi:hypothetical protein [Butyrivibrio fibrisolvens]|uniref:hypothetical protein n=1 Tax=Butyrivibrio fibrisolvens TaxID=831 RepID=UPI000484CF06|nr:hypothetical protein [Butyrivibrio fibrisolvens]
MQIVSKNGSYEELFSVVKTVLKKIDMYGLIEHGAPDDEFNTEAEMIIEQIRSGSSIEDISGIIADVLNRMFGVNVNSLYRVSKRR